jgi:hypothetical protein
MKQKFSLKKYKNTIVYYSIFLKSYIVYYMKREIIYEKITNFWSKDFSKLLFRDKKLNLNFETRKAIAII